MTQTQTTNESKTMKPADITLKQLGGISRLSAMIGAKNFASDNGGFGLTFQFQGCKKANFARIRLNSLDLYDVEFIKLGRMNRKTYVLTNDKQLAFFANIDAENLTRTFEETTGLCLTI